MSMYKTLFKFYKTTTYIVPKLLSVSSSLYVSVLKKVGHARSWAGLATGIKVTIATLLQHHSHIVGCKRNLSKGLT